MRPLCSRRYCLPMRWFRRTQVGMRKRTIQTVEEPTPTDWPPEIQQLIDEGKIRPPLRRGAVGEFTPVKSVRTIADVLAEDRGA